MSHIKDVLDALYGEAQVGICYAAPRIGRCELEMILMRHGYNPLSDLNLLRDNEVQRMCEGAVPLLLADSDWRSPRNLRAHEMSRVVTQIQTADMWDLAKLYLLRPEHLRVIIRSFHIAYRRDFVCPTQEDYNRMYCDMYRDESLRIANYYDLGIMLGDGTIN